MSLRFASGLLRRVAKMPCVWHLRCHEWDNDGDFILSLDFDKHIVNLPEQADIIDALLEMPEPLPEPLPVPRTPSPPSSPEEGSEDNEFGNLASLLVPRPQSPLDAVKAPKRQRHTLLTDALIFKYVDVHGPKWRALARSLGGREAGYSDDAVRNRYIRIAAALGIPYVSPNPHGGGRNRPAKPFTRWTSKEDDEVRRSVQSVGTSWNSVKREFGTARTVQAIRNRANRLGLTKAAF